MDLSRFTTAHQSSFETAYREIASGKKTSHWMWYIFPQVYGLGRSGTSAFYGIRSIEEAKAFLADPYLGGNLRKISEALLQLPSNDATEIFGKPDDMKLRSCMTLFALASDGEPVFDRVLKKFFGGKVDYRTIKILETL